MIRYPDEQRVEVSFVLDGLLFVNDRTTVHSARIYDSNRNEYYSVVVKSVKDKRIAAQEIKNWKKLSHQHIIKLYFSCEYQQTTLLFMESGSPLTW
jgi:hypothetical protein